MLNRMATDMRDKRLGGRLRKIAERAGLTTYVLAAELGLSQGQISKIFNGKRKISQVNLIKALALANATPEETDGLLRLLNPEGGDLDESTWVAIRAVERDHMIGAVMAAEEEAKTITYFAALMVPGLIQTAAYARAQMEADGVSPADARRWVAERIGRRNILERRENPVHLVAYFHEGVLRTVIGDISVMIEQLEYLIELQTKLDNVTIRVVPFAAGKTPLQDGQRLVIESPDAAPLVHSDLHYVGLFLEDPALVERTTLQMAVLNEKALDAAKSAAFIANIISEWR